MAKQGQTAQIPSSSSHKLTNKNSVEVANAETATQHYNTDCLIIFLNPIDFSNNMKFNSNLAQTHLNSIPSDGTDVQWRTKLSSGGWS